MKGGDIMKVVFVGKINLLVESLKPYLNKGLTLKDLLGGLWL